VSKNSKGKGAGKLLRDRLYSVPSKSDRENAKTERGGWTARTLASWGVPWPPPSGWHELLDARYDEMGAQPSLTTNQRVTPGLIYEWRRLGKIGRAARVKRAPRLRADVMHGPIFITHGANANGSLKVSRFANRAELAAWQAEHPFGTPESDVGRANVTQ
jgi:hypothetical protein